MLHIHFKLSFLSEFFEMPARTISTSVIILHLFSIAWKPDRIGSWLNNSFCLPAKSKSAVA